MWGSFGIALNKVCEQCNLVRLAAGGEFKDESV